MTCYTMVRGRAMRVTRLNGCGAVVMGPESSAVSDGFVSIAFTANTEEGETINVTNAAGRPCVFDEPAPIFTGYTVEVTFCGVDPALYALMTGQSVVLNSDDEAVGFQVNSDVNFDDSGFALEVWSNVPGAACEGGVTAYGYTLVPFMKGGVIGDFTIENAAVTFTLSGAKSKDGNGWGVGPYDVVDDGGTPGPLLEALPVKNHLHTQLTNLAPPTPECGAVAIGTPDLSATPGSPSTPSAGGYYPTGMVSVVSTPTTAWTAGQYAADWNGDKWTWNGTAWVEYGLA